MRRYFDKRDTNRIILGIVGKRRSGKDTLARKLALFIPNAQVLHFASSLKGFVFLDLQEPIAFTPWVDDSVRFKLQQTADTVKRVDDNLGVFVDIVLGYALMHPERRYIISDVRTVYEEHRIRILNGGIVKVKRADAFESNTDIDKHDTETAVEHIRGDLEFDGDFIINCNDALEFYEKVVKPIKFLMGWETVYPPRKPSIFLSLNISSRLPERYNLLVAGVTKVLEKEGFDVVSPVGPTSKDHNWLLREMAHQSFADIARRIFVDDLQALAKTDAVLAILDEPSIGVGVEVFLAFLMGKPVVILLRKESLIYHPYLWVVSSKEITLSLDDAINRLRRFFVFTRDY